MENIVIIDEKFSFRQGLKALMELKFGRNFSINVKHPENLRKIDEGKPPKLIITEPSQNPIIENYLIEMKKQGAKVVLLSLEAEKVELNQIQFDGMLMKNMQTNQFLMILEEILEYDSVYIHPEIAYHLLKTVSIHIQDNHLQKV
ncbi:hypothetical protein [Neobacillus sp.]|uniref:hypothetical protein n=1 Tax=Neobacillus sp. TaxID=2675273 RepID=UPI0035B56E7E